MENRIKSFWRNYHKIHLKVAQPFLRSQAKRETRFIIRQYQLGHRQTFTTDAGSRSCTETLLYGENVLNAAGRCDDRKNESFTSCRIGRDAAEKGTGNPSAITPIKIQMALCKDKIIQNFQFPYTWGHHVWFYLPIGQLALRSVSFLVVHDTLSCEDILMRFPVLRHLRIDCSTFLESNGTLLDSPSF